MKKSETCQELRLPLLRRMINDFSRIARKKSSIYGLVEFDITDTLKKIRRHRVRTKSSLSLTAYVIFCIGRAVNSRIEVQGYLNRRGRLVCFDDVDLCLFIETRVGDHFLPVAHVLRSVNKRSFSDIEREIRRVKEQGDRSIEFRRKWGYLRWFLRLPSFARRVFYAFILRNPHRFKKHMGTVAVTAVGMFGKGGGWGVGLLNHTLQIVVGGHSPRPVYRKGKLEKREILSVTIAMDHDVIDGAPGVRFTQDLKNLVERGHGLDIDG